MINRQEFYRLLREDRWLFPGGLLPSAVETIEAVLNETEARGITDLRHPAYMLATARGEVGAAMAPVREGFAKSDEQARTYVKRNFPHYSQIINGHMYYGRGLVQLTWERNYIVMGQLLGIDLKNNPDLALDPTTAVAILFEGMTRGVSGRGDFTGKALEDYFNATTEDWIGARRIINGTDKAATFAAWGKRFYQHLKAAQTDEPTFAATPTVQTTEPKEPLSGFRKYILWAFGLLFGPGSITAGLGTWFAGLNPIVAATIVATLGVCALVVVFMVFFMKRPIVIEKR